jgi:hypothetical protein
MELLKEYSTIILAAIGAVLWFGRLESRSNANSKEIERLERRLEMQRKEDMESNRAYRDDVKVTLKSIQDDIKLLLQRGKG